MEAEKSKEIRLEALFPIMEATLAAGKSVHFSPRGISMLPMLHQGVDTVTLSPLPDMLRKYDLPLYRRDDGHFVLHRIVRAGDTYTCCGDNQYVYESGLRRDQMLALVTAFTHKGKTVPVTHPGYRLYCILWCASRPARHFLSRVRGKLRRMLRR